MRKHLGLAALLLAACSSSNHGDLSGNPPKAPEITTQPTSQSVSVGETATFNVAATGTAPLAYQWQKNGTAITGATAASYTTPSTSTTDNGATFEVTVTNSAGSITSNTVTLTVNAATAAPAIVTQPANQSVAVGQSATFSVVATGTAPLTYQWLKKASVITGATGSSYTTPAATTTDNGATFTVTVSNSLNTITSNPATLTVTATAVAPTIVSPPTNQSVTVGQSATFSVVAAGTAPLTYQWLKNGTAITGATGSSYTTPAAASTDNDATFKVTVTNAVGSITSAAATLTVIAATTTTDVLTYHNDNSRTGQNLTETTLTPSTVNSTQFGLLRVLPADGLVDGQPLIASALSVNGTLHNVVYVVTENDSVYAYDADTGTALAHVSVLGSGETPSDDRSCGKVTPQIGITSTPVIDRSAGAHGTIYVVAMSKDASGDYHQRLHALDLATLAELANSPVVIQATYPGTGNNSGGTTSFDPKQYKERAGLLLANGTLYTAWASHCDDGPYQGWIIGYDQSTLAQTQVLNVTPNGSDGALWSSGGGMAADSTGNIYALVANGTFDTTLDASGFPMQGDYGNAFIKLSNSAPLQVADYFDMDNTVSESTNDEDLGSGGPMLLPDQTDATGVVRQLAVGAGKDGHLYVINRANMGKFSMLNNAIWEDMPGALPGGVWATPAYYQGTVYYGDVGSTLKAFGIQHAMLGTTPTSQTSMNFAYPGTAPAVSANGSSNGIVWAVENSQPAVLHAFAAGNLATELYNSNQAANGRDHFGNGNKYMTPTIANGKVYVGTPAGVAVFGTLN